MTSIVCFWGARPMPQNEKTSQKLSGFTPNIITQNICNLKGNINDNDSITTTSGIISLSMTWWLTCLCNFTKTQCWCSTALHRSSDDKHYGLLFQPGFSAWYSSHSSLSCMCEVTWWLVSTVSKAKPSLLSKGHFRQQFQVTVSGLYFNLRQWTQ